MFFQPLHHAASEVDRVVITQPGSHDLIDYVTRLPNQGPPVPRSDCYEAHARPGT